MPFWDERGVRQDGENLRTAVALGDITPNQVMPQAVRSRIKIATNHQEASNYSISSPTGSTWSDVDETDLAWSVELSGDPLELQLSCVVYCDSTVTIRVSISIDGTEVTGGLGMIYQGFGGAQSKSATWIVPKPTPGKSVVRVVWWLTGAAGGALMFGAPSGAFVSVIAREL